MRSSTTLRATATLVTAGLLALTAATPAAAAPSASTQGLAAHLSGEQEPKNAGDPDANGFALLQLHRNGKICYVLRVRNVDGALRGQLHGT
ncbi:CHRD domain-containing protein [Dactylosporangium sp. AC04546]|uniref:CHRD domain-containing protein n=1 Tax=Dactylosporangium sp. AC04546 TaxID=2862460 RepID=UPI001EE09FA7|nr:CHRD domain-containing protein [Dactylosporangium sp. AC04546]WVK85220.1 CHRD domain-containing protein [Dactylosporangium sp. AC04546]